MHASRPDLSDDEILGGRLRLLQPRRGHRVGHDAILLAAATGAAPGDVVVDLGAGVGGAGLALAARQDGVTVALVEIDAQLAALAAENAARNRLADRVRAVVLDVAAPAQSFAAAGLRVGTAARVMMNPPFHDPARHNASPDPRRRLAHVAGAALADWARTAARLLAPHGVLTLIWRADGIADVLSALAPGFGAITLLPVHPRPDAAAIRILVRAQKASRAPLAILPGLMLADAADRQSSEAEAVLRHGASLPLAGA
jgi:tRNA1(Val) A37 N6-methylase TrmN6